MLIKKEDAAISVKTLYKNQLEEYEEFTPTKEGFDFAL